MSRIFHTGPYEGMNIETIIDIDPAYIMELASTVIDHGVEQEQIDRARIMLDTREDYDDFGGAEEDLASFLGYKPEYDYE